MEPQEPTLGEYVEPVSRREAYEEGWRACGRQQRALDNPYVLYPDLHQAWMDGYEDREDHERAQDDEI